MTSSIASGLLQGIQNPAQADVVGQFRQGQARRQGREFNKEAAAIWEGLPGAKIANLMKLDPTKATAFAEAIGIPLGQDARIKAAMGGVVMSSQMIEGGLDPVVVAGFMDDQRKVMIQAGADTQFLDKGIADLMSGDEERILAQGQGLLQLADSFRETGGGRGKFSAKTEILEDGSTIQTTTSGRTIVKDPSGKTVKGQAAADVIKKANEEGIRLQGARAGSRSGEAETAKLSTQLALRPQIESAITKARDTAKASGEAFTDLNRATAALPGLRDTVGQLKDLALIATSTLGGRVFDTAVKELGFGATKGATAKAKFIAIVNNQVLPLLKPTFGGSFSVQEGQELKATMGDPDSSIEEKLAQLNAFIDQKERDIMTKSGELAGIEAQGSEGVVMEDANGNRALVDPTTGQVIREL